MVSLRIGALFSTMASATTRRGLSTSRRSPPIRIPLKLTLPPLRRPEAGPSNTTRRNYELRGVQALEPEHEADAAAITASVKAPIRT